MHRKMDRRSRPAAGHAAWRCRGALFSVLMLGAGVRTLHAAGRPLWEAGFGVAALTIPDYRGSDERHGYLLPLPYLVYRGEILRVGRHGITGQILRNPRTRIALSVSAGVPVKSSGNDARSGMPDLNPALEIGPVLDICLDAVCGHRPRWSLRLPARAVIATDLQHTHYIGWVFSPHIGYDTRLRWDGGAWNFGVALGPEFATTQHNAYYYQVDPQYATVLRPAYAARGGYGGMSATMSVSRRFRTTWFGAFVRYDSLAGAVFEDSPLVRARSSVMAGIGISWILVQSATMVRQRR